VNHGLVPATHIGRSDLLHLLIAGVYHLAVGRSVERPRTLHKEAVRVLMRLANDNVLLGEATVVPMGQVMRLGVLQVH